MAQRIPGARWFAAGLLPLASPAAAAGLDGAALGLLWALPFAGMLLSIALVPLASLRLWHYHYGKIAVGWALATLVPLALVFGPATALDVALHTLVQEYVPFMVFIGALYVVAGGIFVRGNLHGGPLLNTGLLGLGAALASVMGTTGASMLLIRPIIRANDHRRYRVHTIVFFIFIVSNIGGALTPLGDPPLFLGFLKGMDFFWTARHLAGPMLLSLAVLLALHFVVDTVLERRDRAAGFRRDPTPDAPLRLDGGVNLLLLAAIMAAVLASGTVKTSIELRILGHERSLEGLLRDAVLVAVAALSMAITPRKVRRDNEFSWAPIAEVAKLFFGIFVTMAPALLMLKAGADGSFAGLVRLVSDAQGQPIEAAYFWLTGGLSSFLDNAPTYLVFFNLAGGDPQTLMSTLAPTLVAISAGAVFMGANTYIGNAPNFIVKAIAEQSRIPMPSFFGYMAWSGAILLPLFLLLTWIYFR